MSVYSQNVKSALARSRLKLSKQKINNPNELEIANNWRDESVAVLDNHDPNYDSEDSESSNVIIVPTKTPPPSKDSDASGLSRYRQLIEPVMNEFFVTEDFNEFKVSVLEIANSSKFHSELVRRLIIKAMERHSRERELTSRLLAFMSQSDAISVEHMQKGFEKLLETCGDLSFDIPQARDFLSRFLARAVSDEVIPPVYLQKLEARYEPEIVKQAKKLLSIHHAASKISRIWGTPDDLKEEIKLVLLEYQTSGDVDEAIACIYRLNAPNYHHEVVRRAIIIALNGHSKQCAMMSTLLYELYANNIVASSSIIAGFKRIAEEIKDLELDVPFARKIVKIFIDQAVADGIVRQDQVPRI